MDVSVCPPDAQPVHAWTACMRAQDFAGAWRISDAVLADRNPAGRDDPALPYHLRWVWDGTPPDGRDVLVRCYHGLGDTLQFARFLPSLRARAAHVTLEAPLELCPLLAHIPGVDRLVPFDMAAPLPPGPCDIEIMELGHVLRADAPAISARVPYLHAGMAPPRYAGTVGLCWQAGGWDRARSVSLDALLARTGIGDRPLVSLQRGPASAEATHQAFINPADGDMDLVRTAALIRASSCVVTVDTAVAHLAGALGHPVFVLLQAEPDWRWPNRGGAASAWYPTATLLWQDRAGDWNGPLDRLRRFLDAETKTASLQRRPAVQTDSSRVGQAASA